MGGMRTSSLVRCGVALCALSVVGCGQESEASTTRPSASDFVPSDFARFVPVGDDEGRFETAITSYRRGDGVEVSLIAAIHIADPKHYVELQKEFSKYDVLLYELVAHEDDRPKPGDKRGGGLLTMFQTMLKNGLELEFQLDGIDYTPANFVHADLTPEAFREKMEERGETMLSLIWNLMTRELKRTREQAVAAAERRDQAEEKGEKVEPTSAQMLDLVTAFRRREGRHTMRMMLAQQLENLESMVAGAGPDGGTVLLEGRNERALEVLQQQIAEGRKKLAIYFGAAHMTGIERTLVEELGFEKVGQRWLTAWDISKRLDPVRRKRAAK